MASWMYPSYRRTARAQRRLNRSSVLRHTASPSSPASRVELDDVAEHDRHEPEIPAARERVVRRPLGLEVGVRGSENELGLRMMRSLLEHDPRRVLSRAPSRCARRRRPA